MHIRLSMIVLLSTLTLFSCAKKDPVYNSITNVADTSGVIYGKDDRQEIEDSKERDIHDLSSKVAAMIKKKLLTKQSDGSYKISQRNYGKTHVLCPEERFYDQISVAKCTVSLISKNRVLTAGHCAASQKICEESLFVFDYKTKSGKIPSIAEKENVYGCKKLVRGFCSATGEDWAIIELDRDVVNRTPVTLSDSKSLRKKDRVVAIGFPKGLPMKVAPGKVRSISKLSFLADIDTYDSNSGGPVFDKRTGHQIGIVVKGARDFIVDNIRSCKISNICAHGKCAGEKVQKVDVMKHLVESKPGKMEVEHPYACGVPAKPPATTPKEGKSE